MPPAVEEPKQFGEIFLRELNAVSARRRRLRIEQVLGELPTPPANLPAARAPDDSGSGRTPSLKELEDCHQTTKTARQQLEQVCRGDDASDSESEAVKEAARVFLDAAKDGYEKARRYCDAKFKEAKAAPPAQAEAARAAWEKAEAIFAAAAAALSLATEQDRARPNDSPRPSGQSGPGADRLGEAYGRVLAEEVRVRGRLDEYCKAAKRLRDAEGEVLAARNAGVVTPQSLRSRREATTALRGQTAKLHQARHRLASAEQALFQTAEGESQDPYRIKMCRQAAAALLKDVQRTGREWRSAALDYRRGKTAPEPETASDSEPLPDPLLKHARRHALDRGLVGLALSGGGIRSATFALGVLQGLAQLRLLGVIDYLSSVSGGGYIASWFAAWVRREGGLANVERQLSPSRVSQAHAHRPGLPRDQPLDEEPEPIHHLRAYSRYLAPRFGVSSPGTWTLFTIYLRNLFVNTLFILPIAVAVVLLWRLLLHGYDVPFRTDPPQPGWEPFDGWQPFLTRLAAALLFTFAFLGACISLFWEEEKLFDATQEGLRLKDDRKSAAGPRTPWFLIALLLLTAVSGSWILSLEPKAAQLTCYAKADLLRFFGQPLLDGLFPKQTPTLVRFVICFGVPSILLTLGVRTAAWRSRRHGAGNAPFNWKGVVADLALAVGFGAALYLALLFVIWPLSYHAAQAPTQTDPEPIDSLCLLWTVAPPLILAAMVLGGFVETAVVGRFLHESEREWRARLAAYLLMAAVAWLVVGGAVFFLPWLMEHQLTEQGWVVPPAVWTALWGAISGGGAWAATRKAATDPREPGAWWLRPLALAAPFVFLVGLLAGVSALGQWAIDTWFDWLPTGTCPTAPPTPPSFLVRAVLTADKSGYVILIAALWAFGCSWISVNRFSLHMLYANRLTRCYLGASRRKRRGEGSLGARTGVPKTDPVRQRNEFTGFDPLDDFPVAELRTIDPKGRARYAGPIPIINCALNCLAGDELAYQDRRADAFAVTPEACGGRLTGYADTPDAGKYALNMTVGRAMTISGAAVDPNMHGLSSPLTALMTLFNTRLGWWVENPHPGRRPWGAGGDWRAGEPGFAWPLLYELLGMTNERRAYVHLSDGGHFENLGVYELVRRRCRYIIVVDAGTDRTAASDNMAAMVRLVRTDFGVRIELDAAQMQVQGGDDYSAWHCALGRVRYDEVDEEAVPGVLVYLQATLTGDEPPDLLQYVSRCPEFPRQSTLNQFFDEAQFECYRVLGHHTALNVFGQASAAWTGRALNAGQHMAEVQAVFAGLRDQWFPPTDFAGERQVAAAEAALQLEQQLAADADLTDFCLDVYPELRQAGDGSDQRRVQDCRAVGQTLKVMQMAWAAMKLDDLHAHPRNRGWMDAFRRWTASPPFQRYWPFLRAEYSKPFVAFCENVLNLQTPAVEAERCDTLPGGDEGLRQLVAELNAQFAQEWSVPLARLGTPPAFHASNLLGEAADHALRLQPGAPPFLWLLQQRPAPGTTGGSYCCGLVCVRDFESPRQRLLAGPADLVGEAEFFVWLRGPYRTLGVGTEAVRAILREVESDSAFTAAEKPLKRLLAFHPVSADPGGRMQVERWMNFFFDLGFRRRQPDAGPGTRFVVLTRGLNEG